MVMKALQQLLHEVEWGGLDVLVLDLPPGTGDVQLTITQQIELDGMRQCVSNHIRNVLTYRRCGHRIYTPRRCTQRCSSRCRDVPKGQSTSTTSDICLASYSS